MNFQTTILSGDGFTLTPRKVPCAGESLILKDVNRVWDLSQFQTIRRPVVMGRFDFLYRYPRILDLPIKMLDSEYRIPEEVRGMRGFIQQAINFEHSLNPRVDSYYCYLTIDQGWVEPGQTQRRAGCHVDGFQGARINPKGMINRSYLTSNCLTSVFYPHAFQTQHLREDRDNFFLDFDRQAREDLAWRPQAGEIVLADAYCVHRCDVAIKKVWRTFARVSFDVREFDRLGNTHNPMFKYQWEMVARETQKSLR